ncbi:hypothetical protein M0804_014104 [Polistes exclamans]|nr:hypothetical protein M0804_014104 [Polistes exclamans]
MVCKDAGRKTVNHRAGSWECPVVSPRKTGAGVFVSVSERSAGLPVSASASGIEPTKGPSSESAQRTEEDPTMEEDQLDLSILTRKNCTVRKDRNNSPGQELGPLPAVMAVSKTCVQKNWNHACGLQELLAQRVHEGRVGIGIISEPCRLLDEFEELLGSYPTLPALVAGDFNVRAPRWDPKSRRNLRGELLCLHEATGVRSLRPQDTNILWWNLRAVDNDVLAAALIFGADSPQGDGYCGKKTLPEVQAQRGPRKDETLPGRPKNCQKEPEASFHAAMMVAGVIRLDHLAPRLVEAYAALESVEGQVPPGIKAAFGAFARWGAVVAWREEELNLVDVPGETGVRVRAAIGDRLVEWVERPFSIGTTFYTTQLLTGHGCFPAYLHRIGRAASPRCFYCGDDEDNADHSLIVC